MAWARDLVVNPANPDQFYILFGDGRIVAYGGALNIPQSEATVALDGSTFIPSSPDTASTYYFQAPTQPGWRLQILDWDTPSGWTLDIFGTVNGFGGAISPGNTPNFRIFLPAYGFARDFSMDAANSGKGYILDAAGDVWPVGPGVSSIPHGAFLGEENAKTLVFNWSNLQHFILDGRGNIHSMNGAPAMSVAASHDRDVMAFTNTAVDMVIYDLGTGYGFIQDAYGVVHEVNGGGAAPGYPYSYPSTLWYALSMINDDPTELMSMTIGGSTYRWVASTAPTVTVTFPTDPTTTTTRPTISWGYADAEHDAQVSWKVKVFDAATYSAGGFNPDTSTPVWSSQGTILLSTVKVPIDLDNGFYRAYVQVEDTSHLLSTWAYKQWEQDVIRPDQPTITATANSNPLDGIDLEINYPGTVASNLRIGVQYHDAGEIDWHWVRDGLDLIPDGGGDVSVTDYEARLATLRTYRAFGYYPDWIAGPWSTTDSATLTDQSQWLISNIYDHTQAQVARVLPDISLQKGTVTGQFAPVGRPEVIVVSDSAPRSALVSAKIRTLNTSTRLGLERILDADCILLRDPYGREYFCKLTGSVSTDFLFAAPLNSETTPLRDANVHDLQMQSMARPSVHSNTSPELDDLVA